MVGKVSPKIGILVALVLLVLAGLIWRVQQPPQIRKPPWLPPLGNTDGSPLPMKR